MNRVLAVLVLLGAIAAPAHANICALDAAPAATLLFPFVSFDFNQPWGGDTTVLSITNLSAEAQVVRVAMWTDIGIPFLEFNVLLSGYDVQRINVRDILYNGTLPVTVSEGHNDREGVMNLGPISEWNDLVSPDWLISLLEDPQATSELGDRCTSDHDGYPGHYTATIPTAILDLLKIWLQASEAAAMPMSDICDPASTPDPYDWEPTLWFERRDGTGPSWMFVTADVVESCSRVRPVEEAYWLSAADAEEGEARYENVLTGDALWISSTASTAMPAIHLEADVDLGAVATNNPATGQPVSFYARYANSLTTGSDFREPLPTAWAVRYMGAGNESIDTRLMVWKGSTNFITPIDIQVQGDELAPDQIEVSTCNAYTVYTWDEDSNALRQDLPSPWSLCQSPVGSGNVCPNLLPQVVQELSIDELYTVDENGWMLFVWPASNYPEMADVPATPDFYQTWMSVRQTAWGTHADFIPATPMANFNCFADQTLPGLGLDYDYVDENGYRSVESAP